MIILLGSADSTVIMKWTKNLKGHFEIQYVQSIGELKKRCASRQFDAIILHRMLIDMPAFARMVETFPAARFFLLSDRPDEEEALSFLKLGIAGYGNTYISASRLKEALRVITNGGVWLGQKIIQRLIRDTAGNKKTDEQDGDALPVMASLTKSERRIAGLVAKGQSNLEIAADLKITERTVKAHLTSIYKKTNAGNRLNLALMINLRKTPEK